VRCASSEPLQQTLAVLASQVAVSTQASTKKGRPKRRSARPSDMASLVPWEEAGALVPRDPSEGMLLAQQEEWRERLAQDRVMEWSGRLQAFNLQLKKASQPSKEPPPMELPPAVVQDVFDGLVEDPQRELQLRRDLRRSESLAIQIEHILACPPAELQKVLKTKGPIQIAQVDAAPDGAPHVPHVVHFMCGDADSSKLQRRLDKAAPVIAKSLARRLLIGYMPALRFVHRSEGQDSLAGGVPALQHGRARKVARRTTVHKAMQSWSSMMNW